MKKKMIKKTIKYRLGLDLGTNSIGWCMLRLNANNKPIAVIKSGVRIFHDGRKSKTDEPLAVERRIARSIRRNIDRKISRRNHLLNRLVKYSLLPKDENERKSLAVLNPYEIRNRAVNERIELHELGRALIHLSKRRGFKSNRKVDKEDSSGKIKPAIEKLKNKMQETNKKTVGEYLYFLIQNGKSVRARLGKIDGKEGYEIYLDRSLIEEEFNIIMNEQKKYHEELTDDVIKELFNIIFFQRPLKPQIVGKCSLEPNEIKLRRAHVLAQSFNLLQTVQNLKIYDRSILSYRKLTIDEKEIIKKELNRKKEMTYVNIQKLLSKNFKNNIYGTFYQKSSNDKLKGNKTNAVMANKDIIGDDWYNLSSDTQYEIVDLLFSDEDNNTLRKIYAKDYNLSDNQINGLIDKAVYRLDSGYSSYGKTAITKLNKIMDQDNLDLHYAREKAGYGHENVAIASNHLEYYGKVLPKYVIDPQIDNPKNYEEKYGKNANPTVHIALNQLRKLINELIDLYGKPKQIVLELARDLKNNKKAKDSIKKKNAEQKKINEKVDKIIQEYSEKYRTQIVKNKLNRDKVKLWLELSDNPIERRCIYTGELISIEKLFSDDVQIEHIVPFSRSLDDSMNNKTLSMRVANYYKGNKTPYEAFKDSKDGYIYEDILARAELLNNRSKFKRFTKNAMEIYEINNEDFIARQLTDTQYLSKLALTYIKSLFSKEDQGSVWVIPGQLTALIRSNLGLNNIISEDSNKNRNDHRHHAIDAFVVAVTSRFLLQKISEVASKREDLDNKNLSAYRNRILDRMPEPFPNYRNSLEISIRNIKTSHKIDRSISGKLHEETAYGIVKNNEKYNVVTRWTLDKFKEEKHFKKIRDKELNDIACTNKELFNKIVEEKSIKSLRVLEEKNNMIKIKDKYDNEYKAFVGGNNICVEIYEVNGKKGYEIIQLYYAAQKKFEPNWMKEYPNGKLLMRLFKGDVIGFVKDQDNERKYYTIQKINLRDSNLGLVSINSTGHVIKNDKSVKEYEMIILNKLFNDYNAKQYNISVTGIVSKSKYADINFWKNRK